MEQNSLNEECVVLSIDDFEKELIECLSTFKINMKNINMKKTTFPQWFEMFMHWNEVNTDMEEEYYGPRCETTFRK